MHKPMKPYINVIKQDFQSYPEHYNARALSSVIYCIAHTRIYHSFYLVN